MKRIKKKILFSNIKIFNYIIENDVIIEFDGIM